MIKLTFKIVEDEVTHMLEVFINAKNEELATQRESDFAEQFMINIGSLLKETAEALGATETEMDPINIVKKLASQEDIERYKNKDQ